MRYIKLISIVFIISVFSACSSSPSKKDTEVTTVLDSPDITAGNLNSPKVENSTMPNQSGAFNIDEWKHPTKDVFQEFNVKIINMKLLKENTYPVFYVELPKELNKENITYFDSLISKLSEANGYWNFEINDEKGSTIIEVSCDRINRLVTDISVNCDKGYFNKLKNKTVIEKGPTDIIAINRKQAGLSTVVPLNFTKININKRLKELLADPKSYKNSDYKNGIVMGQKVLVSERYKGSIIDDIKIGTGIDYVKKVLGEPNVAADEGFVFYKTKEFYIGFKGNSKVEYAILANRSIPNNKDILELIIKELDAKNDLVGMIENNNQMADFFDENGHINGGGWYANSYSGMEVVQFNGNTITIYNNFEGDLFRANNLEYDIKFIDSDYQVNNAISCIQGYIADNDEFAKSGVLSPSGKLKCTYFWGYSMCYYFKIRTLDNSTPDFRVPVPVSDFKWLTDDYILYLNTWTSAPYIVKVSDNMDVPLEDVNIMHRLGVFGKDDYFQDFSFQFSIKSINGNTINLYDSESNKEYHVVYSIGKNGIELKFANN